MEATVRANNRTEGYVRVIVTRGPGTIGPDPRKIDPQVYIIAEEYQPFPADLYGHGLHVVTSEAGGYTIGRPPLFRLLSQHHIVKAKRDALAGGCLEAVLVDDCFRIYGCTEGHLFRVFDGVIRQITNFPGDITAHYCIKDLAESAGVPFTKKIEEIDHDPYHLLDAEEVFLAGTSCGVIGIVRLNGEDIGGGTEGPVTRRIREAYRRLTRGPE
jgi:branched-chain amino acid aminotransferase